MKRKKDYAVVAMVLLLVVMMSFTGFAEELTVDVIEDVAEVVTEEIEEATEEAVTATIIVKGENNIVLTVDTEGIILTADYAKELEEGEVNPLVDLAGKSLEEGLTALDDSEEPIAYSVTIYSDDTELVDKLEEALKEAFGDLIEIDTIKTVDFDNPNAIRFMMAMELGITPGKMNLLEKLGRGYGEDALIVYEDWAGKSVKEIMAAVKEERKESEEVTASTTEETQAKNSNKPAKATKTNNSKGKNK